MIIFQTVSFFISSWLGIIQTVTLWLPHTTCLSHSMLTLDLWCHLLLFRDLRWTFCTGQKRIYMKWCYLQTLAKAIQRHMTEFPSAWPKPSWLFVVHCPPFVRSFVWVLWHINHWELCNAKSIFIQINSSISNNSVQHKFNRQKLFYFKLFSLVKQFAFKQLNLVPGHLPNE